MRVLGIETSCDETAASIVLNGRHVLSNIVSSQVALHRQYGGVVPELASRAHLDAVIPIIDLALKKAGIGLSGIDVVAVTRGPGLIGALMVGVQVGKGLALALDRPLVGVNHIAAHLYAAQLSEAPHSASPHSASPHSGPSASDVVESDALPVAYPHIALAVSGGHTALYRVDSPLSFQELGSTLDDAAGEAFDKVALMLGLGYPGGRVIDDLARGGRTDAVAFPRAWLGKRKFDFSFSGLKTAVRTHVKVNGVPVGDGLRDLLASFQEAVADVLVEKAMLAAKEQRVHRIVVAGGVGANSRLRALLTQRCAERRVEAILTPLRYCTDNAAMVAGLGYHLAQAGDVVSPFTLDPDAGLSRSGAPA